MANIENISSLQDRDGHQTAEQKLFWKKLLSTYQISYDNLLKCYTGRQSAEDFEQLSTVLNELEKKTHFKKRSASETADIASAITEFVEELLKEMGSYDESCLNLKLLNAGGYFDGTKIYSPDEFDFVVDIRDLSSFFETKSKDEVEIDYWKEDSTRVNVRVLGKPDRAVAEFCPRPYTEDSLGSMDGAETLYTRKQGPPGIIMNKKFANLFTSIFKQVMESFINKGFTVTRPTGTVQLMSDLPELLHDRFEDSFLPFYAIWTPKSSSDPLGISVDVTPSFRLSCDYTYFNDTCVNIKGLRRVSERIGKDKCYMRLVLRDDNQWKLSLSHVETELIRKEDEIHRKCSRILKMIKEGKHLINKHGEPPNVKYMEASARCSKFTEMCTSYAVKTAVIRHIMSCENNSRTLGSCFVSILCDVEKTIRTVKFTGYFLGLNMNESACTEQWEIETLTYLTYLNNIITEVLEKREVDVESVVQRLCQAKKDYIREIEISENYKEIEEWYIGYIC